MKGKISVRDVMVAPVITITPDKTLVDVAKLMLKHEIGGVVVVENGDPIGIITEYDFVKLMATNTLPSKIKIKEVMSTPLITVSPNLSILDAARLMTKSKTRKLPVKSKNELIGIITAEDIVKVAPREIELLLELASIKSMGEEEFLQSPTEGECENCGNYSDYLYQVGGMSVCSECKDLLAEEE